MEQEKLNEILRLHGLWLNNDSSGIRADLRFANLTNADLQDADLTNADLQGANLVDADLTKANLKNANLVDADLTKANLKNANLVGANLTKANLKNANLKDANLQGADLRYADLVSANLVGANLINATGIVFIGPIGSRNDILYAVKHSDGVMFKTGCFWGTYQQFIESVNQKHQGIMAEIYVQAADVMVKILN